MPIDVDAEVLIRRPRAEVASWVTDPANDRTWILALSEVNQVTDPPIRVGSRVERVARFLGRRIVYLNEVVEYEAESRLVMKSVKAPFPMAVRYEFTDAEGGATRVRVGNKGGSGIVSTLTGPLMGWMVNRQVKKDLLLLKSVLEAE
jgi:hypothetical protein